MYRAWARYMGLDRRGILLMISLCTVVRNEATWIKWWVRHVKTLCEQAPISDVVIIHQRDPHDENDDIDTSKELVAATFMIPAVVSVINHDQIGYSSLSRDIALKEAKQDWRFILDADETLEHPWCLEWLINSKLSEDCYGFWRMDMIDGRIVNAHGNKDHQPRLFYKTIENPTHMHAAVHTPTRHDTDFRIFHLNNMQRVLESTERTIRLKPEMKEDHRRYVTDVQRELKNYNTTWDGSSIR